MQKTLTLWHFKVINQHHLSLGSASCLLLTLCSRAFIMFFPLVHTIKMCCSDTCISAKVILQGCQNTLSYCHEHQPPPLFFPIAKLLGSLKKMALHKFIITGYILFEKNPMSVTLQFDLTVISSIREWEWEWRNTILSSNMTIPEIPINLRSSGHRVYILQISFVSCRKKNVLVLWYTDLTIAIPLITNDLGNPCYVMIHIL